MLINPATLEINKMVIAAFGSDFRADWKIVGIREEYWIEKMFGNHRIILERTEFPDVVASFSPYLPSRIKSPSIVARVSEDGGKMIVSEGCKVYNERISVYARAFKNIYGKSPKIQTFSHKYFLDYLMAYGSHKL